MLFYNIAVRKCIRCRVPSDDILAGWMAVVAGRSYSVVSRNEVVGGRASATFQWNVMRRTYKIWAATFNCVECGAEG